MFKLKKDNTESKRGKMSSAHILILISCCMMASASFGLQSNVAGVYYAPVTDDLGIGRGTFSFHVTLLVLSCAIVSLIIPTILKKVDFQKILLPAAVINALTTALMGVFKNPGGFYIMAVLRGSSMSFFFSVPITIIINNWFVKNRGLFMSLVFSFSGIIGVIFAPLFTNMINSIGWRATYLVNGILTGLFCLPAILAKIHISPATKGLTSYGIEERSEDENTYTDNKEKLKVSYFSIPFISLFIGAVFVTGTMSAVQHFPGYVQSIGVLGATATVVSAAMLGNIVFKFLMGVLGDKLGAFKGVVTMMISMAAGLVLITFTRNSATILLGSFMFGAGYSVGTVGLSLMVSEFFGSENYSKIYPPIAFAANVGFSVIMTLVGFIYDTFGSYFVAWILCFALLALAYGFFLLAKNTGRNMKLQPAGSPKPTEKTPTENLQTIEVKPNLNSDAKARAQPDENEDSKHESETLAENLRENGVSSTVKKERDTRSDKNGNEDSQPQTNADVNTVFPADTENYHIKLTLGEEYDKDGYPKNTEYNKDKNSKTVAKENGKNNIKTQDGSDTEGF
jgi:MFS family permease